ncbi:MAG: glycoside hydrolase family 57 protein [Bacteroidaceae bacterium]|nr:glycoside hydrolase family 57 protein [Bacteroidaceae bacterium]
MKTICLYFEIHQPIHLKRYRFFDIGTDHYYYDDYENERIISELFERSYRPALQTMLDMIAENDKAFKVAFSISGVSLELIEQYAPEMLDLLGRLAASGCVEFLAEPYSHGLSSLGNTENFIAETKRQAKKIKQLFGQNPKVFRNSSLIYNDEIGATVADMGFKGVMVEGAKHILGWKSPHYIYSCAEDSRLSLILRDYKLSDDIGLRFNDASWSEYPLMADKWLGWVAGLPEGENVVGIMMELAALGYYQPLSSHILDFLRALPKLAKDMGIQFATPSEVLAKNKPVSPLEVIYPVSWNDEERDTSSMLGNGMQREAFNKLYDENIVGRILASRDRRIQQDWDRLQATENFRFMTTKNNGMGNYRGIYDSEYDAFTNYMNILGDFLKRVKDMFPDSVESDELNSLYTQIANMGEELNVKDNEISRLRARLKKLGSPEEEAPAPKEEPKAEPKPKKAEPKPKETKPAAKKEEPKKAKPVAKKPAAKKAAPKAAPKAKPVAKKPVAKKPVAKKAKK